MYYFIKCNQNLGSFELETGIEGPYSDLEECKRDILGYSACHEDSFYRIIDDSTLDLFVVEIPKIRKVVS